MLQLLSCVLNRRNLAYMKSRNRTYKVLFALSFIAVIINVIFAFASIGSGIGLDGSMVLLVVVSILCALLLTLERAFRYDHLIKEETEELFLKEKDAMGLKRYAQEVMQEPYKEISKLYFIVWICMIGFMVISLIELFVLKGVHAGDLAYRIVLTIMSAILVVSGCVVYYLYKKVVKKHADHLASQGTEFADFFKDEMMLAIPRSGDLNTDLCFKDEKLSKRFRLGKILEVVFAIAAVVSFLLPLPVVLGKKSVVGIIAISAVFVVLMCGVLVGYCLRVDALKKSASQMPDTTACAYRKMNCRLLQEFYTRWGVPTVIVFLVVAAFASVIGILENFGVIASGEDAPGLFIMLAMPLILLALLWFGVDTMTGYKLFKVDFVVFTDLLRPGLVAQDALAQTESEGQPDPDADEAKSDQINLDFSDTDDTKQN